MENQLKGKKILWIEDDKLLDNIVEKKMASTGAALTVAKTGEHALEILEKEIPDIVIVDIILPGINGFEILKKIKADPKIKHVPVILLSNLSQPADIEKGKAYGADLYLVKATVNLDEVIVKIIQVLNKYSVVK